MAVTLNKRQDKIMVGTYGCELIELPIDFKLKKCDVSKAKFCVWGHYAPMLSWTNEVWGLSVFSGKNRFVTSGDDSTLRIWDATAKKQIGLINLDIDKLGEKIPLNPKTKEIADAA
jgi:WD40 repeat protein